MVSETIRIPHNYEPRDYQVPFLSAMADGCTRAVKVWHRRAGKEKSDLNHQINCAVNRVGYYPYFFPTTAMGRRILWHGMDKDGFKFSDHFPKSVVKRTNSSEMLIELVNGSIWQIIGTDNIENVGVNPIGCVFSEYSLQNPKAWDLIRPILAENGGWASFNFTPRGRNHGQEIFKMATANPKWFCELLTVDDTHAISLEAIQDDRDSGMSEDMVQQEYYCSFDLGTEGSYYSELMSQAVRDNRICSVPHDPAVQVSTAWDLGVSDSTVIWFVQQVGMEIHLIDYYQSSGKGIAHYIDVLRDRTEHHKYNYKAHYAPHDVEARQKTDALSVKQYASQLGLQFVTLPKMRIAAGIEAVRALLPRCWFDDAKCSEGIKALENYRKRLDEKNKVYSNIPQHDWASHPADSFRYLATSLKLHTGKTGMTTERIRELESQFARPQ